jgi:hypothetical protein
MGKRKRWNVHFTIRAKRRMDYFLYLEKFRDIDLGGGFHGFPFGSWGFASTQWEKFTKHSMKMNVLYEPGEEK